MALTPLLYRSNDPAKWGDGIGSDLTAPQIDGNFFELFQGLSDLEAMVTASGSAGIDYFTVTGNKLYVTLTDHEVLGPYTLPTAQWNPRGHWTPLTAYLAFDVFDYNGSLYLVMINHTSAITFNPDLSPGPGLSTYKLLLGEPSNVLPTGGEAGQRLVKSVSSPDFVTEWRSDLIRMAVTVLGKPNDNETVMIFPVVDNMTIPAALAGSNFAQGTPPEGNVSWTLTRNGIFIGTVDFSASPADIGVSFVHDVVCEPGDVIELTGPATADGQQANIAFVFVAILN